MEVHNVEQGSDEWFALRATVPTASNFKRIITSTGKASTQADIYAYEVAANIIAGKSIEHFAGNDWTERGNELEADAVNWYEFKNNVDTLDAPFFKRDNVGASPDRLVGDDGLLEIKCPKASTHVKYMHKGKLPSEYVPQVQGQLYITCRQWCDFLSFYPDLPEFCIRVVRDDEFIGTLTKELSKFNNKVSQIVTSLKGVGNGER